MEEGEKLILDKIAEESIQTIEYTVSEDGAGMRLDQFLSQKLTDVSRSFLQKQIKEQSILINGKAAKAGNKLNIKDKVQVTLESPKELQIEAENIPLDILYEDEDIIVINKPKQMVVHPAPGHYSGTVVNALLYHCKDSLSGINGVMRPGIVHPFTTQLHKARACPHVTEGYDGLDVYGRNPEHLLLPDRHYDILPVFA